MGHGGAGGLRCPSHPSSFPQSGWNNFLVTFGQGSPSPLRSLPGAEAHVSVMPQQISLSKAGFCGAHTFEFSAREPARDSAHGEQDAALLPAAGKRSFRQYFPVPSRVWKGAQRRPHPHIGGPTAEGHEKNCPCKPGKGLSCWADVAFLRRDPKRSGGRYDGVFYVGRQERLCGSLLGQFVSGLEPGG